MSAGDRALAANRANVNWRAAGAASLVTLAISAGFAAFALSLWAAVTYLPPWAYMTVCFGMMFLGVWCGFYGLFRRRWS